MVLPRLSNDLIEGRGTTMEDLTGTEALRQLLPPPPGAGEEIDWQTAEERWGARGDDPPERECALLELPSLP